MKRILILLILTILTFSQFIIPVFGETELDKEREAYYEELVEEPEYEVIRAKIIAVPLDETNETREDVSLQSDRRTQHLKIEILNGNHKGETYTVQNIIEMINPYKLIFKSGDSILLRMTEDENGIINYLKIYDRIRDKYVYIAIIILLALLAIIGGKNGIKSILSLIFTGFVVIQILIPLILKGNSPVLVSIFVSVLTSIVTISLIVGINRKGFSALLGTICGLLVSGLMVLIVGKFTNFTGLGSEEARLLAYVPSYKNLNYQGILYAGIILGALGAIMDVTVSISSSMWEMKQIHEKITFKELIHSGLNVGKDIMGSMSNTLILAYTGSSMFLMLLFKGYNLKFIEIINMDIIASEIIRAIAGSIGLVLAIPITVIISGFLYNNRESKNKVL
ncbi:YibE/F family protein [Clostridiaceae bacterium HSG29]|nr:YibE/F family protein [Clostridiaceae bacterium HSG29]